MAMWKKLLPLLVTLFLMNSLLSPLPVDAGEESQIRVGLSTQTDTLTLSSLDGFSLQDAATGNELLHADPGQEVVLAAAGGEVSLPALGSQADKVLFEPDPGSQGENFLKFKNARYRGTFEVFPGSNGKLTLVNVLPMEEYVKGVLSKEMSKDFPLEALKAQAVISRNYALINLKKHNAEGFNVCNTVHCQVYGGVEGEAPSIDQAVEETRGEVATYQGQLATTYFFSSSGGYTENSENVWNAAVPYLVGVEDYDQDSPNYSWKVPMSLQDIEQKLAAAKVNVGSLLRIEAVSRGVSGRISKVDVIGKDNTVELKGNDFRTMLGLKSMPREIDPEGEAAEPAQDRGTTASGGSYYAVNGSGETQKISLSDGVAAVNGSGQTQKLKASAGWVAVNGSSQTQTLAAAKPQAPTASSSSDAGYVFVGGGNGHGVGLSQWGARGMAKLGYNYQEILQHYYQGIELEQRY